MRILSPAEKVAGCAVFTAVALILSYIESFFPLTLIIPLPGVKLGLANIAVMLALWYFGLIEGALVSLTRIILSALLFGSIPSLIFSLFGGILAFSAMVVTKRLLANKLSFIGVSVIAACFHNIGQISAACLTLYSFALMTYLPILLIAAVFCGIITGAAAEFLKPVMKRVITN